MYQYEAVAEVMRENGGYATLKALYQRAPAVEGSEWGTKTPNASIRRIVQTREDFFKIRPGLWALESHRERLPAGVYDESADEARRDQYSHWYFQGLLAEVGNRRQAETWVPSQDRNRAFLETTLGEVRSLDSLPQFGYQELVRRASTVDVVWFNEREMPASFIEVEFSTDFQNSLHKFLDLRDFHAGFIIAADERREAQFEKRLGQSGFGPIRDRVSFLTFDELSRLHAATDATAGVAAQLGV
ncbi:hypothetical protein [Haloarcula sediminis]|uniref:hypothetical protein n=1 Tax=Haloarcula sediminis TaxID=3111777 RepID=UPI002D78943B|nr:hypothetical protein [Haloarcula sp. CK38]